MRQKLIVRAVCLALALPGGVAVAVANTVKNKPDTLLAVDSNRSTVIDGIVASWGSDLEKSGAHITSANLRTMLEGLRADKLLAASLAGSLSGLRDVLSNAAMACVRASCRAGCIRPRCSFRFSAFPITACRATSRSNPKAPPSAAQPRLCF